jgi:DNA (cytosine-5)-methyltransferase 1
MRLLDLFCGAGGAAMGYHRAGFEVTGIDINPQPRYPFEFINGDVFEWITDDLFFRQFDAIHASPPCQDHTRTPGPVHGTAWMLPMIRDRLSSIGVPWVLENVPGAPMRADYLLCGCMFGLGVRRERWFETSWHGFALNMAHDHRQPAHCVVGNGTPSGVLAKGIVQTPESCRAAMGIEWMSRAELSQAIPPAYTEFVGEQMIDFLTCSIRIRGGQLAQLMSGPNYLCKWLS